MKKLTLGPNSSSLAQHKKKKIFLEGVKAEIKVKDEPKKKQQLSTSSRPHQGEGRDPQGRNPTLSSQPRGLTRSKKQESSILKTKEKNQSSQNIFKPKENYFIHIHTTFNNTLINVTNFKGDTIAWASGGSIGPKNARKKGSFAARQVGYALGKKCRKKKIKHVQVKVKGLGYSKKHAIRGIKSSGIKIKEIHEIIGIPYNGCRLRKKKR
jgi:small subunit ribosomal protein S11